MPGIGWFKAIYEGLQWFLSNQNQIKDMFQAFIDSVPFLAKHETPEATAEFVKGFQKLGGALLSLLAAQVGLNKLPAELRAALAFVPNQVDKAIHLAVEKMFGQVRLKNAATKGMYDGLIVDKVQFSYCGVDYVLYTAEKGGKAKVFVAKQGAKEPIAELKTKSFSTDASKNDMAKLQSDGNKLAAEIKSAGRKGEGQEHAGG